MAPPIGVCLQCKRPGFNPWVGKIPWRRKWQPTPVFLPGKSHGQRSVTGYSSWGRKEWAMTERLPFGSPSLGPYTGVWRICCKAPFLYFWRWHLCCPLLLLISLSVLLSFVEKSQLLSLFPLSRVQFPLPNFVVFPFCFFVFSLKVEGRTVVDGEVGWEKRKRSCHIGRQTTNKLRLAFLPHILYTEFKS